MRLLTRLTGDFGCFLLAGEAFNYYLVVLYTRLSVT